MSTVGNAASLASNSGAGPLLAVPPRRRGSPPPRGPDGARLVGGHAGLVAGDAVRSQPAEERQALIPRRFDRSRQPGQDHVEARLGFLGRGVLGARRMEERAPSHPSRSRRWSPTRSAFAMMVRAGFTAELEGKKLPSTT